MQPLRNHVISLTALLGSAAFALSAQAQTTVPAPAQAVPTTTAPAPVAQVPAVQALPDNTYVTLFGTVGKVIDGDQFELQYSGKTIMVDTNDRWPAMFKKDAAELLKSGDRVRVTGKVDDNFFAKKEIDATAIYHISQAYTRIYILDDDKGTNEHYYGSAPTTMEALEGKYIGLSGRVSQVEADGDVMLDYGAGTIRVETDDIAFPETGGLKVGDRVTVYGEVEDNWFEKREVDAEYIVRTDYYPPRA